MSRVSPDRGRPQDRCQSPWREESTSRLEAGDTSVSSTEDPRLSEMVTESRGDLPSTGESFQRPSPPRPHTSASACARARPKTKASTVTEDLCVKLDQSQERRAEALRHLVQAGIAAQDSLAVSALHRRSRRCVIKGCDETGFQDLTKHFAECHRPWFLEANKCCFDCEVTLDNKGHLWQDHFLKSCGALDDEKTKLWVLHMNGLLVDLCWALQLQDTGVLLQLVISQDYFQINMEPLMTIQAALCRTWYVCNRVPVPEVHRQPVDQLGILVHPTVIQNLM